MKLEAIFSPDALPWSQRGNTSPGLSPHAPGLHSIHSFLEEKLPLGQWGCIWFLENCLLQSSCTVLSLLQSFALLPFSACTIVPLAIHMAASLSVVGSELYHYPHRFISPSPYPKGHAVLPCLLPLVFYQSALTTVFIITSSRLCAPVSRDLMFAHHWIKSTRQMWAFKKKISGRNGLSARNILL